MHDRRSSLWKESQSQRTSPETLISGANLLWICSFCTWIALQQFMIFRAKSPPLPISSTNHIKVKCRIKLYTGFFCIRWWALYITMTNTPKCQEVNFWSNYKEELHHHCLQGHKILTYNEYKCTDILDYGYKALSNSHIFLKLMCCYQNLTLLFGFDTVPL